jgi:hypothetical protein
VDPNKFEIVKSCLQATFKDVNLDAANQRFVFNDGQQSSELLFNRAFIDDISEDRLKAQMVKDIVPIIQANPGKRISVSAIGIGIGKKEYH